MIQKKIAAWGRLTREIHRVEKPQDAGDLQKIVKNNAAPFLAYGMGRSYGDVCLNPEALLIETTGLNHFIHFNAENGVLSVEAGVLLKDIQALMIPRGWMLPVTPGTQLVTVGGAIANDVHGKSHHVAGAFGAHVLGFTILRTNGEILECSPVQNAELFAATIGGLGLTGFILSATLQLEKVASPWLNAENIAFESLDAFFEISQNSTDWAHSVAWIDCLNTQGRGIFMRGNFVEYEGKPPCALPLAMPFEPPFSLINPLSLKAFNLAYYNLQKAKRGVQKTHYVPFFYPLDNVQHWNRLYGPRGFYQYQSVIPFESGKDATAAMLQEIAKAGIGSFLAVLKTFGDKKSPGLLSFPMAGVTLALDFPNNGEKTEKLFANLDAIVQNAHGRLYPAKDARMPRALFEAGFPHLNDFLKWRDSGISSGLAQRLMD